MAQYYGVERSEEYLEHYGIKGMKWGVQKARDVMLRDKQAGERKLDRQYRKAQRKLEKLKDKADINKQTKIYNTRKANALSSALGGAIAVGAGTAFNRMSRASAIKAGKSSYTAYATPIAGTVAATDAIVNGIAAKIAKNRTTKEGHAKAVNDVKNWQREMDTAFKGTKYGRSNKRRRR